MKSRFLFFFAFAFCLGLARADLTIVLKVEGTGGPQEMTMVVKGDQVRVDPTEQLSTILNAKTGEMITLDHKDKRIMRISGAQTQAMAEMAKSLSKETVGDVGKPKPTGRKEKINGYDTEEFVTDNGKHHAAYWVAKSYPDYENIMRQMEMLQNGAFGAMRKGLPDFHDLPGLPLRTEIHTPGEKIITTTIETISTAPVADAQFTLPADYSEMKIPAFLNGKDAKPDAHTGDQ